MSIRYSLHDAVTRQVRCIPLDCLQVHVFANGLDNYLDNMRRVAGIPDFLYPQSLTLDHESLQAREYEKRVDEERARAAA